MDSSQRVLATLDLEVPDRVPLHTLAIDGNNVDKVLGGFPRTAFDLIADIKTNNPDDWLAQINGIIGNLQTTIFSRMISAAAALGFDACPAGYIPLQFESDKEMSDVFGRRYKIVNNEGNLFPVYNDGTIHTRADWEAAPKPDVDKICKEAYKFYKTVARQNRDNDVVIMATDDFTSVFPPVWQGMGMPAFARALRGDPALIEERFEMTTTLVIALIKTYARAGAKVFFDGEDVAFKSGPLIHPKYVDQYLLPHMKRVTETAHEAGCKIIFHSDGDITSLLDFVVAAGYDGLHCLEGPYVDPAHVKKKVGDKLCLLGNIDTSHVLVEGSRAEVRAAVKDAITALGEGGGYMLSPTNSHPAIELDRLQWMIEATKELGTYPLDLEKTN